MSKPIRSTTGAISMLQLNVKLREKEWSNLEGWWEENDCTFFSEEMLNQKNSPKVACFPYPMLFFCSESLIYATSISRFQRVKKIPLLKLLIKFI